MAKYINEGKIFEEDFASSINKETIFLHRLKDTAQSYNQSKDTKYTWNNPCDYFLFNGEIFFCFELKSTKSKSISYQRNKDDKTQRMIKWHQIEKLTEFSNYKNVLAGFVLNYRDEKNNTQRTYFLNIKDFNKIRLSTEKHSINEIDILLNNAVKIGGHIKKIHWHWDINEFLETQTIKYIRKPNNQNQ